MITKATLIICNVNYCVNTFVLQYSNKGFMDNKPKEAFHTAEGNI